MDKIKQLGLFRLRVAAALQPFNMYGQHVYFAQVTDELVRSVEELFCNGHKPSGLDVEQDKAV